MTRNPTKNSEIGVVCSKATDWCIWFPSEEIKREETSDLLCASLLVLAFASESEGRGVMARLMPHAHGCGLWGMWSSGAAAQSDVP